MPLSNYLFFDCETTGLPQVRFFSPEVADLWPRLVQIAWARFDARGNIEDSRCHIVRPEGFRVPDDAARIHGISHARACREGRDLAEVIDELLEAAGQPATVLVGHNLEYDRGVVGSELVRLRRPLAFLDTPGICTMKGTTDLCRLPRLGGYGYKWPTLEELHAFVFGRSYEGAHDAARDLEACARCFFTLLGRGHFGAYGD